MKVLFLTIGEAASTRYRVHQLLPLLERLGVRATVREVPRRLLPRLRLFHSARDHDAVVLQKRLTPPWQTRLLRRHSRRLLYDVDDAVLYRSAPAAPHSRMRLRRWRQAVRCADLVLAGNRFLGEQVQAHGGRAILVPTTLDPAPYDAASPSSPRDDALILVWIGSRSTLHYLEALEPALRRAADRSARPLKLRVICDVFPPFDFIEVLRSPWSSETQCRDLSATATSPWPPWTTAPGRPASAASRPCNTSRRDCRSSPRPTACTKR